MVSRKIAKVILWDQDYIQEKDEAKKNLMCEWLKYHWTKQVSSQTRKN